MKRPPRTWRPKVPEGHLLCLHLPGHVLRHALVNALVRLLRVPDHEGSVVQQVQAGICLHAQLVAVKTEMRPLKPLMCEEVAESQRGFSVLATCLQRDTGHGMLPFQVPMYLQL